MVRRIRKVERRACQLGIENEFTWFWELVWRILCGGGGSSGELRFAVDPLAEGAAPLASHNIPGNYYFARMRWPFS